MLVFTRKRGEAIVIGDNIEVVILSAGKEGLRVGVRAPQSVPVHRKEIYELIREENRTAAGALEASAVPARVAVPDVRPAGTCR
jgi:carbon storage regulator